MSKSINVVKPLYNDVDEDIKFLIVCKSDIERKSLGGAMINFQTPDHYGVHVHLKKHLPLSNKSSREHFDFIVFVIDLKEEKSFKTILDSLGFVDLEYFLGKCCFVVVHDDSEIRIRPEIEQLEEFYRTPVLYANFSNENEIQGLVSQILKNAEISCGLDNFI